VLNNKELGQTIAAFFDSKLFCLVMEALLCVSYLPRSHSGSSKSESCQCYCNFFCPCMHIYVHYHPGSCCFIWPIPYSDPMGFSSAFCTL